MYIPFENVMNYQSLYSPQNPKFFNSKSYDYWVRALYQRLLSVFKWDNLPEEWTKDSNIYDYLMYCLIAYGYVVCLEDDKYGKYFTHCTLKGQNIYHQPTSALIADKTIRLLNKDIIVKGKEVSLVGNDKKGALLQLTPDKRGLFDILNYYAEKLAMLDSTINTAIINARTPYIVYGKSKTAVSALQLALDKIMGGEPATFLLNNQKKDASITDVGNDGNKTEPIEQIKLFSKEDYITNDLLIDRQKILDCFDNEIGIPTSNTDKRERQTEAEITCKQYDSCARANTWITTLQNSVKGVNELLNTNISVDLRIKDMEAIVNGDEANGVRYGNVSELSE